MLETSASASTAAAKSARIVVECTDRLGFFATATSGECTRVRCSLDFGLPLIPPPPPPTQSCADHIPASYLCRGELEYSRALSNWTLGFVDRWRRYDSREIMHIEPQHLRENIEFSGLPSRLSKLRLASFAVNNDANNERARLQGDSERANEDYSELLADEADKVLRELYEVGRLLDVVGLDWPRCTHSVPRIAQ